MMVENRKFYNHSAYANYMEMYNWTKDYNDLSDKEMLQENIRHLNNTIQMMRMSFNINPSSDYIKNEIQNKSNLLKEWEINLANLKD